MSIPYLAAELRWHGLDIKTDTELREFLAKLEQYARQLHPCIGFDEDVELFLLEQAAEVDGSGRGEMGK